jgi:hypothetical protein
MHLNGYFIRQGSQFFGELPIFPAELALHFLGEYDQIHRVTQLIQQLPGLKFHIIIKQRHNPPFYLIRPINNGTRCITKT